MDQVEAPAGGIAADALSRLLFKLYGAARVLAVPAFQHEAMALLSGLVAFDGCWWGRGSTDGHEYRAHTAYLEGLPADLPQRLNTVDRRNIVARVSIASPDRTHLFGVEHLAREPATQALMAEVGVRQVLCIARYRSDTGQVDFLSVVRRHDLPAFTTSEGRVLDVLSPHFAAALDACCATAMATLRRGEGNALLTVDGEGWVQVAEPAIGGLLRVEWPGWTGPRLPAALAELLLRAPHRFHGRHLRAHAQWSGAHLIVKVAPRHAADGLTGQERAVAHAFASGLPYKEVAARLKLAPATVRHHLRSVYLKLGVNDKAALARALVD